MTANLFIVFALRAIEDVDAASEWYSEQQQALAVEFLDALNDTLGSIARNREAFIEVDSGIRRALLKKFPYSIYYTIGIKRSKKGRDCVFTKAEALSTLLYCPRNRVCG